MLICTSSDVSETEDTYCEECDTAGIDYIEVPVDEFYIRFQCKNCGFIHPKVIQSDYGFQFENYLLNGSQYDEGVSIWEQIRQDFK